MWNEKLAATVVLPVLVALGGCSISAAPLQAPAANAPQSTDRYRLDLARNRLWLLTPEGVVLYRNARRERIVIALPDWLWAGAPYGCAPDLALGPKGEAVITSDIVPTLWRIDPQTLQVSVHPLALDADGDKDVGFGALSYSPKHGKYFAVSPMHGSVWSVDASLTKAQKVASPVAMPRVCGST